MILRDENLWRTNQDLIRDGKKLCKRVAELNDECQVLIDASRAMIAAQPKTRAWNPLLPHEAGDPVDLEGRDLPEPTAWR